MAWSLACVQLGCWNRTSVLLVLVYISSLGVFAGLAQLKAQTANCIHPACCLHR